MKKILVIEVSASGYMPWRLGESHDDGTYTELRRGKIPPDDDGSEYMKLEEEVDEIYEVDSLAAHTNERRVK